MRQRTLLCLGLALVAAGQLANAQQPAQPATGPVRLTRDVRGDAKPLIISADEIVTWVDGTQRVIFMRGMVLAQQSVISARFQQGVAWVDLARWRSGILHVSLYGEGKAKLDGGTNIEAADQILIDVSTRGELRLQAYRSKVGQASLASDPLVQRAWAVRGQAAQPPAILPVSATKPVK